MLTGDTATIYKDTSATKPGARYAYVVKALRGEDQSQASNQAQVEIPNPLADLAPSNLAAQIVDDGVSLTWDAPAQSAGSVTAYEIERTAVIPGQDNPPAHLTRTADDATSYADASANEAGARYTYRVLAVRGTEQSQWSGTVSVELPEDPPVSSPQLAFATLASLTISDGTENVPLSPTFAATTTSYRVALKYRGHRITVAAAAAAATASIDFLDVGDNPLTDADTGEAGHQVDVPVGTSEFKIKVTPQGGINPGLYEVEVERDSAQIFGWTPSRDISLHTNNENPQGVWSNGTTIWVADDDDDKLYAYTLATSARDISKDISLHTDNDDATGIWSDSTTIWVADDDDDKLYAYTLATSARDTSKDISLHTDNVDPQGVWSNGTTIWVADNVDAKLYAYTLATSVRDTSKEFLPGGLLPTGIWSKGATMWVTISNGTRFRARAFRMDLDASPAHGTWDTDKSFEVLPEVLPDSNTPPVGVWSDGNSAIWVMGPGGGRLRAYNMLPSATGGVALPPSP